MYSYQPIGIKETGHSHPFLNSVYPQSSGLHVGRHAARSGVQCHVRALSKEVRMVTLISALILVLAVVAPSFGQQSLVGTYKIVSHVVELGGTPTEPYGKGIHGYLVLTPTRAIAFYTGDTRQFGTSTTEKLALLDTLCGYSGVYRVEGGKLITRVDASWLENWNGKDQSRNWQLSGNRLMLTSDPQPFAKDPSKTVIIRQVWEKIE